jgi:DNA-binding CsgD family transcriptional regulator
MSVRQLRDRVADAAAAAALLSDPDAVIGLAVEAVAAACPRGITVAFTRGLDGGYRTPAVLADGVKQPREVWRNRGPLAWVVDINNVPAVQRDRWIEPIPFGVHGPGYFTTAHPITAVMGSQTLPEYGRMMVCHGGRLVAWIGTYVEGRHGFSRDEQAALVAAAAQLAMPLRVAAALAAGSPHVALVPRQHEIVSRLAVGWSNKRIARDLDISPATVKTVLERLFRASGAANRTALVAWWRRGG